MLASPTSADAAEAGSSRGAGAALVAFACLCWAVYAYFRTSGIRQCLCDPTPTNTSRGSTSRSFVAEASVPFSVMHRPQSLASPPIFEEKPRDDVDKSSVLLSDVHPMFLNGVHLPCLEMGASTKASYPPKGATCRLRAGLASTAVPSESASSNVVIARTSTAVQHQSVITPRQLPQHANVVSSFPLDAPRSMRNLGNTCYMNATLQCVLRSGSSFRTALRQLRTESVSRGGSFLDATLRLLNQLEARRAVGNLDPIEASLEKIKDELSRQNSEFLGNVQNDADEFLGAFQSALHKELNRSAGIGEPPAAFAATLRSTRDEVAEEAKALRTWRSIDDSEVYDHFGGMRKQMVSCSACKRRSITFVPFLVLPVDCGPKEELLTTLVDLLISSAKDEPTRTTCTELKCGAPSPSTTMQLLVSKWPRQLVVLVKRFSSNGDKISKRIAVPVLVRGEALLPLHAASSVMKETRCSRPPECYRLQAAVCHRGRCRGNSAGGHYVAYVQSPQSVDWYLCNDSVIEKSSESAMSEEVSTGGYLLFFEAE